ncbi:MAG: protein-methionine-sulfoxide reductase catalytic subunit MsrP [Candidatus Fonsibacter ubiquis]|jgi:sulfoxide reductase catalytic subunit YedY|nr:protein-methionine-sulfoxide reductase catalytic subunit MsrP [Candidatus Fonsibacter ubiquis]
MTFKDPKIKSADITPKEVFKNRRNLLKILTLGSLAAGFSSSLQSDAFAVGESNKKLKAKFNQKYSVNDKQTSFKDATTYNNFYEFGMDKDDPARYGKSLITRPWTVSVEGLVQKPQVFDFDSLIKLSVMEERVYRMRCVEGWSMVIPWNGFSLSNLLNKVEPLGTAKYVEFVTLADPKQMPGLSSSIIAWPYLEGLRLDEAMNPLTLLTFGIYGEVLPNQNGAPVRIVIPWKYGFKSAKSIVKIRLTDKEPVTSWHRTAPMEYGFYSNVNPNVSHPRWSQSTERRIDGRNIFSSKIKTEMFNGYGEHVAGLYAGMDLRKFY